MTDVYKALHLVAEIRYHIVADLIEYRALQLFRKVANFHLVLVFFTVCERAAYQ